MRLAALYLLVAVLSAAPCLAADPPSVCFTYPTAGATVSGASITGIAQITIPSSNPP